MGAHFVANILKSRGGGTCHNLGGPKIKWKFFDFHVAMYA